MRTLFHVALGFALGVACSFGRVAADEGQSTPDKPAAQAEAAAAQAEDSNGPFSTGEPAGDKPATQATAPCTAETTVKALRPDAAEARIRKVLTEPTTMDFVETPFTEVVQYLEDLHKIQIQLDGKALDEAGITTDTPITRNLQGVSLESALYHTLRGLDLTWVIDHEVLIITTKDQAEEQVFLREYPVADLVGESKGAKDCDTLLDIVKSLVAPATWCDAGGVGDVKAFRGKLLVLQTEPVHRQLTELLAMLRAPSE